MAVFTDPSIFGFMVQENLSRQPSFKKTQVFLQETCAQVEKFYKNLTFLVHFQIFFVAKQTSATYSADYATNTNI